MDLVISCLTAASEDFVALTHELDREFAIKNGEKQKRYDRYNKLEGVTDFVIAHDREKAVACGALKPYDPDTYEVKRVYVKPEYRGRGISKMVMAELEAIARRKRARRLILETSKPFTEAIGLYTGIGFTEIENYGQYVGLELSLCMEKKL